MSEPEESPQTLPSSAQTTEPAQFKEYFDNLPKYVKAFTNPHVLLTNMSDTKQILKNTSTKKQYKKKKLAYEDKPITPDEEAYFQTYPP